MAQNRQIEHLPKGWVWSDQPWTYTTKTGIVKHSTARHGHGPHGEDISLRQVQDRQKAARLREGIVRAAPVRRTGRIRTFRGFPGVKRTQFGPFESEVTHGIQQSFSFYSLDAARAWVMANGLDPRFEHAVIQIKYTEKITDTSRTGSPTAKGAKGGFATITPFRSATLFNDSAPLTSEESRGEIENPWVTAEKNLSNYDMTGSNARVYIYMAER